MPVLRASIGEAHISQTARAGSLSGILKGGDVGKKSSKGHDSLSLILCGYYSFHFTPDILPLLGQL